MNIGLLKKIPLLLNICFTRLNLQCDANKFKIFCSQQVRAGKVTYIGNNKCFIIKLVTISEFVTLYQSELFLNLICQMA